ncbi:unnamed protein product [Trichogramma brassicae]|uniref:BCAS3 WD40 domain-containing protein n=1 Tax=Trichogramma brassicae TaxID=86971 RepID=A0A6H5I4F1_9HYME|nr:unnamed protein product [Trichogramma brassicae]
MSADSPRRPGGGGVVTAQHHKSGQVVSPQPVSDRSIIDSMAGIINDIVPQAYAGSAPSSENRESITWARFEYADISNPAFYPDYNEGSSIPPLLLVLGYTTGVQVWLIAASGDATEVLSWRQGQVRTLRLLPSPLTQTRRSSASKGEPDDPYKLRRPLVAICDSAGPGAQFCNVSFLSLKTGEQVKSIKFKSAVCDVLANKRSIVVTFPERIAVFDAKTLDDVLSITTCYPSPGPNPNPVALGTRWLAYSEKKLIPSKRSSGGSEGEGVSSYTATVLYAAKSLGKGLRGLGETVASSLTGNSVTPMAQLNNSHLADNSTQPGVVTIIDLQSAKDERESDSVESGTIIAHFTAHSDAIVAMTFDQTGALLMTADKRGHDFHGTAASGWTELGCGSPPVRAPSRRYDGQSPRHDLLVGRALGSGIDGARHHPRFPRGFLRWAGGSAHSFVVARCQSPVALSQERWPQRRRGPLPLAGFSRRNTFVHLSIHEPALTALSTSHHHTSLGTNQTAFELESQQCPNDPEVAAKTASALGRQRDPPVEDMCLLRATESMVIRTTRFS